ncbi:hypothetical protein Q3W71_08835 [Micromonospora sp. C28SCA-DRY-2]|uniref:DUF6928 family protein n=1 Tax=Micromonospora sp. C28SCA-DRY-2 TaxID=3059522 RepID=UPI002676A733|nr:hypothetical protein [Micromonospora sp. C28SCA-DRY-2]MDO3701784.1 hypothetical protein [Micromonospora sp. C28SCA-DRY-2]
MGAKTALLAFADGDIRPALRAATRSERADVEALVRQVHPGYAVEPFDESTLWDDVYPPDDVTYATKLAGAELYCDRRLALDRPSDLPEHLRAAGAGRRIVMHGMHSVVDCLSFAVWEDGVLIRSLSLSPDGGIRENIGEPYDFELPYWAGEHPVEPVPGWPDQGPHPLPFHPLALGEQALRALFGFIVEGRPEPDDVDAENVHLHGFRVTDPSGREQAAREAAYAEALRAMGPPRTFRLGPDGTMHEVSP